MSIASFGPGIAIVTRTDVTPSTPINAGYCNSMSLSFKGSTKELYGQNQFALVAARSTIKATGKIVSAFDSGIALNSMFFGQSFTAGGYIWNIGEAHSIPATGPYTVTATNSATFDVDLGVVYAATLLPFQKVASGPTVGQYSVSAGVYTFAAADEGAAVAITYSSTVTTPGQNMVVANQPIGYTPVFQLDYYTSLNQPTAKAVIYRLFSCISDSVSFDYKLEDFAMPNMEFSLFANASGNIMKKVYSEVS
jgi:hypothetical protein